ncbi:MULTISPECIES: MaoC family dehydratase [Rhodococcus]|uniref:Acyl dehydratase n=1 Tax=Nocardia globerula TaxID=1818 RepID=A0A652YL31_NOCGL|nr:MULTISPECIES: MaoC family dehydratase [Rhodococcus]KJF23859.1 putative enoyl-CoA hydratase 1 [Rhodococcus sp. AD45]MDV8069305.1 MaoC family dehydratase [Rhodococcus sp. IEGM 1366]PVX63657.1 acyl dehydratase [Rhodococcus globerulus]
MSTQSGLDQTDFTTFDDIRAAVGTTIGTSDWITIDQKRIDLFAAATDDDQWIHVDTDRAADGPYGATIAHGFLTLSLLAPIVQTVMAVSCARMALNYGLGKVRFISPVLVDSRVRGTVELTSVTDIDGGIQVERTVTITAEGSERPACVAQNLVRYLS